MDTWIQVGGVYHSPGFVFLRSVLHLPIHLLLIPLGNTGLFLVWVSKPTSLVKQNPHNKENTLDKHCNSFVKQTMPLKAENWPERWLLLSLIPQEKAKPCREKKKKTLASVSRQLGAFYKLGIDPGPCLYRVPAFLLGHCSFFSLNWVRNRSFPLQSWMKSTQRKDSKGNIGYEETVFMLGFIMNKWFLTPTSMLRHFISLMPMYNPKKSSRLSLSPT